MNILKIGASQAQELIQVQAVLLKTKVEKMVYIHKTTRCSSIN